MSDNKSNGKDIFEISIENSDRLLGKIEKLLKEPNVVWEGLGPDGIDSMARDQGLEYADLEKEFRNRIVKAYQEDDLLTMGKMFHFLLSSYVQSIALKDE